MLDHAAQPSSLSSQQKSVFYQCVAAVLEDAVAQLQVLAEISPSPLASDANNGAGGAGAVAPGACGSHSGSSHPRATNGVTAGSIGGQRHASASSRSCGVGRGPAGAVSGGAAAGAAAGDTRGTQSLGAKTARERQVLENLLSLSIDELRVSGKLTSLQLAVDEENRRRSLLTETQRREREKTQLARELQRTLTSETAVLDSERRERDAAIVQLRDFIQEVQAVTAAEQKYEQRAVKAREAAHRSQFASREAELETRLARAATEATSETRAHAAVVDYLARRRTQLEKQIATWMERHERDTDAKATELDSLKARRAADSDRFEELAAKYEQLAQIIEDDRVQRTREITSRLQQGEENQRNQAARAIQAHWRRHRIRIGKPVGTAASGNGGAAGRGISAGADGAKSKKGAASRNGSSSKPGGSNASAGSGKQRGASVGSSPTSAKKTKK